MPKKIIVVDYETDVLVEAEVADKLQVQLFDSVADFLNSLPAKECNISSEFDQEIYVTYCKRTESLNQVKLEKLTVGDLMALESGELILQRIKPTTIEPSVVLDMINSLVKNTSKVTVPNK